MVEIVPPTSTPAASTPAHYLTFPISPIFSNKPPTLISFDDFTPSGIFIPLTLHAKLIRPVPAPSKHRKPVPLPEEDDADDLLGSQPEEFDADGQPTIELDVQHSLARWGGAKGRANQKVERVKKEDCFVLGKEVAPGGEEWVEPHGTCKGEWPLTKAPYERALRALTQYFNSRSLSLNRGHYMFARAFRRHTRLQTSNLGPHLPGSETLSTYPEDFPTPSEMDETSPFIRDMEGCLRGWWEIIVGEAGEGWNLGSAYNSIEIVNSYLHYLLLHKLLPEPYLHSALLKTASLSRRALHQITAASTIYSSQSTLRLGWQAICAAAFVKGRSGGWEDQGWEGYGDGEWEFEEEGGAVGRAKMESERREKEKREKMKAEEKDTEEEKRKLEEEGKKWSEGNVDQAPLIALLTKQEAQAHLTPLIAPLNPEKYKILQNIPSTKLIIKSAKLASKDSCGLGWACLEGLVEMEFVAAEPTEADKENEKEKAGVEKSEKNEKKTEKPKPKLEGPITLFMTPDVKMAASEFVMRRVMEEMVGMGVVGRWAEIEIAGEGEGGEGGKRIWVVVDVKRVVTNL